MKKQKLTKEQLLIEILERQCNQSSLLIDIVSDLQGVDKGELKIFNQRQKTDARTIKKLKGLYEKCKQCK